jgi:xylulokinase
VGVTGQVNTHVFCDAGGRPLTPAILWQDLRAAPDAASLDARIAERDRIAWWGAPVGIDASHALARMAFVARTRPGLWAATARVLLPRDVVVARLTGAAVTDALSHVGLVGADLMPPPALLSLVPGAAEKLPPFRPMTAVAGGWRPAPGLPEVPVAVGTMDAWAGFLGAGMRAEGDAVWLSGTSEVLAMAADGGPGAPGILIFPKALGLRVHAGPTQAGGAAAAWFGAVLGLDAPALADLAATAAARAGPLFLPHLAGERAPLWDAAARGAFLGLEPAHGRAEMARAVLEGVAFAARLALEAVEASAGRRAQRLVCGGGGFRSDAWARIRADATGRRLVRAANPDCGLAGAAAIAAVAAGIAPDLGAALGRIVAHDRSFEPDPAAAERATARFALYRPAWEALRGVNAGLAAAGAR